MLPQFALDWTVYVIVRLFFCVVQAMPIGVCQRWARPLAWLLADVLRIRRGLLKENLRYAFPDMPDRQRMQLIRGMWEHLILLGCEIAHLPRKVHETNWREHVRLANIAPQVRALLSRRPCVILSAHFGNFEAGGYMIGLFGFRTHTIARPLDNVYVDRWLNSFRQAKGQFILPKHDVAKQIALMLERGENLVLLGDQFAGRNGCWIDFFGRPASYHKAIALFSMTSRAPLLVSYARRVNGRALQLELDVEGEVDPKSDHPAAAGVRELTQWYNDRLEEIIRRNPEQYWWLHNRWKGQSKRRGRKRDRKLAA